MENTRKKRTRTDYVIVHCTATPAGRDVRRADVDRYHRSLGYDGIGYHYLVRLDGIIEPGRLDWEVGAHCRGLNDCSIGVAYVGGLDADGRPADTRTKGQRLALLAIMRDLRRRYPNVKIRGHRDFAAKACPSFDATAEYAEI